MTVSGRTTASASRAFGNSRQIQPNTNRSAAMNGSRVGIPRRKTVICCRSTRTSASSAARDRNRSTTSPNIDLMRPNIRYPRGPNRTAQEGLGYLQPVVPQPGPAAVTLFEVRSHQLGPDPETVHPGRLVNESGHDDIVDDHAIGVARLLERNCHPAPVAALIPLAIVRIEGHGRIICSRRRVSTHGTGPEPGSLCAGIGGQGSQLRSRASLAVGAFCSGTLMAVMLPKLLLALDHRRSSAHTQPPIQPL